MTTIEVIEEQELSPGERVIIDVNSREIGVFNIDGEYYALPNRCPHQGGPLCEGPVADALTVDRETRPEWSMDGEVVYCPWHQLGYHIPTGESLGFSQDLPSYDVYVDDGHILLEL